MESKSSGDRGRDGTGHSHKRQRIGADSHSERKHPAKFSGIRFQHGNFDKYYGYRLGVEAAGAAKSVWNDPRLSVLPKGLVEGKRVLDIGCNAGYVTIELAEKYGPSFVLGVDIDGKLIHKARKLLRSRAKLLQEGTITNCERFPLSCRVVQGVGDAGRESQKSAASVDVTQFPHNVLFRTENFVASAGLHSPAEYDVIFCLSVTKWIHLNGGDAALLTFFHKVFELLAPGGTLVLEPQMWKSYKKKRNLCQLFKDNLAAIQVYPDQLPTVLLEQVGFSKAEQLMTPAQRTKGFERPIYLLTK